MIEKIVKIVMHARRRHSFVSDMFISFIITFAAAVLTYEKYIPESFIDVFSRIVLLIFVATWLGFSFLSGAYKKNNYMIFMFIFWLVPQIIIYAANSGPEIFRMSITMYLLSEFFDILTLVPAGAVGSLLGLGALPSMFIIILLCVFFFLAGMLLSNGKTWKKLNR